MRDQTIKADAGKRRLSLVPGQAIYDIAEVREYGVEKYGTSESWKRVEIERYIDAAYRHFLAYIEDRKSVDAESGIEHYKHLACNIAFICELEKMDTSSTASVPPSPQGEGFEGAAECQHEWLIVVGESNERVTALRCKRCGKKKKRLNEMGKDG